MGIFGPSDEELFRRAMKKQGKAVQRKSRASILDKVGLRIASSKASKSTTRVEKDNEHELLRRQRIDAANAPKGHYEFYCGCGYKKTFCQAKHTAKLCNKSTSHFVADE